MMPRTISLDEKLAWIRKWSSSEELYVPMEDWHIVITSIDTLPLIVEMVLSKDCIPTKKEFFLGCLYCFVGDIVRTNDVEGNLNALRQLLAALKERPHAFLQPWEKRVHEVLKDFPSATEHFDYALWCQFGYAHADFIELNGVNGD